LISNRNRLLIWWIALYGLHSVIFSFAVFFFIFNCNSVKSTHWRINMLCWWCPPSGVWILFWKYADNICFVLTILFYIYWVLIIFPADWLIVHILPFYMLFCSFCVDACCVPMNIVKSLSISLVSSLCLSVCSNLPLNSRRTLQPPSLRGETSFFLFFAF